MRTVSTLLLAGALVAAPLIGTAAQAAPTPQPTEPSSAADNPTPAAEEKRALSFELKSQKIKDDSSYGLVEEYTFTVTNTGNVKTDSSLHAFNKKGESYIDDEGHEMWLACDWTFPGLEPQRTITCRMQVRIDAAELKAGKTTPQEVHFRGFKKQQEAFPGFTTKSIEIPAEFLPPAEPTAAPTGKPTASPSATATGKPTASPSSSAKPSASPEESAEPTEDAGTPDSERTGSLPRTGTESAALIAGGVALLTIGGASVAVSMRRRADRS